MKAGWAQHGSSTNVHWDPTPHLKRAKQGPSVLETKGTRPQSEADDRPAISDDTELGHGTFFAYKRREDPYAPTPPVRPERLGPLDYTEEEEPAPDDGRPQLDLGGPELGRSRSGSSSSSVPSSLSTDTEDSSEDDSRLNPFGGVEPLSDDEPEDPDDQPKQRSGRTI